MHFLGQSADVVVAFDGGAGDAERLDAVGVYRALCQPLDVLDFTCFFIEDVYEAFAYDFALGFGVGDAGQFGEEFGGGIDAYDVEPQSLVVAQDVGVLVFAQHSVVYEYAGEAVADGAVEQYGGHGRVHTAAQAQYYAVVA